MAKKPVIGDVLKAKGIYGCRWFKFPIDVVNHENGLENRGLLTPDARLTCGSCKRFETPEHITQHKTGPKPRPNMQGLF
jgi:hypothetical protein